MPKLISKLLFSALLLNPFINSQENEIKYLPLEKKLREIENDFGGISSNVCMHKAMRYYINAVANGEDTFLIVGWRIGSEQLHDWVGIKKNGKIVYVDPSCNAPNIDGREKEFYVDRKELYRFDSIISVEDFVCHKKNKERFPKTLQEFNSWIKTPKIREKSSFPDLISSIKNYCKKDSLAWKIYEEKILQTNHKN